MLKPSEWDEKYSGYLFKYALSKVNDYELARDLVQETFLSGLEMVDRFEQKSSELTWLTAILKYKIFLVYRRKAANIIELRDESPHPTLNELQADVPIFTWHPNNSFVSDPLVVKEFHRHLHQSVYKLPTLWQSVFYMKYCNEDTSDIICSKLNLSPANYWVICHRTRLSLRSLFLKHWTAIV